MPLSWPPHGTGPRRERGVAPAVFCNNLFVAELKTRILVVDDDQRLRDLLVKYLGGEGYEVKAVHDGAGMDKQLSRERYDLLVLDLMLPGEDGLSICRRLRAKGAPGGVPGPRRRSTALMRASSSRGLKGLGR